MTLQQEIAKASQRLSELRARLAGRAAGRIKGGKRPTLASVAQKCRSIVRRPHLKEVIRVTIEDDPKGHPRLTYDIEANALNRILETHPGKTTLIVNRAAWSDDWWPLNHGTDSKVCVHGIYSSMAQLLRSVMWRRVRQAGLKSSLRRLLSESDSIREVINLDPKKGKTKHHPEQTVLTRRSSRQQRLIEILGLEREEHQELG
jgi:hypothetical protein